MLNNVLEYKGYYTIVKFDSETKSLRGIIEGITDYVDFETRDLSQVENEFQKAVDDYLAFCKEVGKNPEKEYKGTFNIRVKPVLHKKMVVYAAKQSKSLNATIEEVLEKAFM